MKKNKTDATDFALAINHKPVNGNGFAFKYAGKRGNIEIDEDEVDTIVVGEGSKDDANKINSPEATSFTLAEYVKKEYALKRVFSPDVAEAHKNGDIHLQKLGFIDRPYCSGQSVEYVKKFGLERHSSFAAVKPAAHADALIDHLHRMTMALRAQFGGAIGWDAVNMYVAPYLVGMSDGEIYQVAQKLIYSFNETTGPHGAQPVFSDINLYWEIPAHFAAVPAIGPRGEFTGKVYQDYEKEAQALVWQIFNVYHHGDANGAPFFWPKPNLHITKKFWQTPQHEAFLEHVCNVAATMGNPYFIIDRSDVAKISECCRISFELSPEDLQDALKPWKMRYAACPYLSPNLPRLAYRAKHDDQKFFRYLDATLALLFKAHLQKRSFLKRIFDLGELGPLSMLAYRAPGDDEPYLRFDKMAYLIALVGVDDAVRFHLGKAINESAEALKLALKIVAHIRLRCHEFGQKHHLKMVADQAPSESTCYRLARLDLEYYPDQAKKIVHGNFKTGEVYYTNSTQVAVDVPMDPLERIELEGRFHPLMEGGCMTHIWIGEKMPSPASLANVVKKTFYETQNVQIAFSPEFTVCFNCGQTSRGLHKMCSYCHSRRVDGITRITGYYSFISAWNKGKKGELRDRYKVF
ncbi:MAG: anaerobic ribonucleoside-triphosphate reductase [Candidatus Shapirobacteria bacterium]